MSEPFLAEIKIFAGNFAPRGWAFCDGQLLPISQNTALFALIGTTYGGDGRTTTALPNLQGRAAMHAGRGPGLTSRLRGQRSGVENVVLEEAQIPSHSHILRGNDGSLANEQMPSSVSSIARARGGSVYSDDTGNTNALSNSTLSASGGGQAHNNMQPFLTLNFIIALQGLFPSRS